MICPKCGAEIPEGRLYCQVCGNAIQIVPDFEPDIEEKLASTRQNIAGAVKKIDNTGSLGGDTVEIQVNTLKKAAEEVSKTSAASDDTSGSKHMGWVFAAAASVLCVIIFFIVLIIGHYNSFSSRMNRADIYFEKGEYEKAAKQYIAAADKNRDSGAALLGAGKSLQMAGDLNGAVNYLKMAIAADPTNEEAYNIIIDIYKENSDYASINRLIASCSDDSIYRKYTDYLALPPDFSYDSGNYNKLIEVMLSTHENNCEIYYTTDGSQPTVSSDKYRGAIKLREGSNIISAISVNSKGFISATISKNYEIELIVPPAPVVMPEASVYILPSNIVVSLSSDTVSTDEVSSDSLSEESASVLSDAGAVSDDTVIYYTTDGSAPTDESKVYEGPIPMPIGHSVFSFVAKSADGVFSNVTTVKYDLNYTGRCTPDEAVNYLIATLINDGALLDVYGHVNGLGGCYSYSCRSCASAGSRVYYMIDEFYTEPGEEAAATGTMYAVDSVALGLYKTKRDENGNFVFEMFY